MNDMRLVDITFKRMIFGALETVTIYACTMMSNMPDESYPEEPSLDNIDPESFKRITEWMGCKWRVMGLRYAGPPSKELLEFEEWMNSDAYHVQTD